MSEPVSPNPSRIALVLGGGGPVGLAWLAGLADGLRARGVDLCAADRFVGTSAGAIVAAALADGGDLSALLRPRPADAESRPAPPQTLDFFAPLREPGLDLASARRKVGELALGARAGDPADHIASMGRLTDGKPWPTADLVVTSVEVETGRLRAWTAADEATLAQALAASTSVPGVYPPIPIGGNHYIDGGIGSPINADLAAGADLVVIMEPLAHMYGHLPSDGDLGGATAISIVPDTRAIAALGPEPFNLAALTPAFESGVRQAEQAATILTDSGWPTR